ncbi:MAG TPA: isoprenylcysteine carboxylmethyltransferase family protein [Sporichthyaceae bacterium]|nr:isoprenylcysteine carboxylmethyltransferase family protein [Sporichthyaceae bacterium]
MDNLRRKAWNDLVARVFMTRAVVLFVAAGTLAYREAWVFLALGTVGEGATNAYLLRHDKELLRRRLSSASDEVTPVQRKVQKFTAVTFSGTLVSSGLDHRFHWSHIPSAVILAGDLLVVCGLVIIWAAFRANTFASAIITVEERQTVVAAGPYALVRHPMYTGLVVMMLGVGPALGSWWGLVGAVAFASGVVVRLLDEERFLAGNLVGYTDYRAKVRHRLAPLVW